MQRNIWLLLGAMLLGGQTMALEKPEYEVLHTDGNIEYRLYQPYLVAETEVVKSANRNQAANEGFMRLFRYITGANTDQTDIAMTAPVQQVQVDAEVSDDRDEKSGTKIDMTAPVQQVASDSGWRIAFMLPVKYTLADAPVPTDDRIKLRAVPGRMMAVIRYSGRWTNNNVDKHLAELQQHLAAEGIDTVGAAETAAYNAPYTPPFLRRNEIMLEVTSLPRAAEKQVANSN